MKNTIAALMLATSLAGCATTATDIATIEAQIQADAKILCGFVPTISTVAQILAALFPSGGAVITAANAIASQICSAVVSASPKAAAVIYYPGTNVEIHGAFVGAGRYRR
jgi:hypothetical protein